MLYDRLLSRRFQKTLASNVVVGRLACGYDCRTGGREIPVERRRDSGGGVIGVADEPRGGGDRVRARPAAAYCLLLLLLWRSSARRRWRRRSRLSRSRGRGARRVRRARVIVARRPPRHSIGPCAPTRARRRRWRTLRRRSQESRIRPAPTGPPVPL